MNRIKTIGLTTASLTAAGLLVAQVNGAGVYQPATEQSPTTTQQDSDSQSGGMVEVQQEEVLPTPTVEPTPTPEPTETPVEVVEDPIPSATPTPTPTPVEDPVQRLHDFGETNASKYQDDGIRHDVITIPF